MLETLADFMAKMRYYGDAIAVLVGLTAIAAAIIIGVVASIWKRLKRRNS